MRRKRPLEERFWNKVRFNDGDGCWEWAANRFPKGYGSFMCEGRAQGAHRIAWRLLVGEIPEGLVLDHLCRNHPCVRPSHMEIVTNRENILRGVGASASHVIKTHCPKGHPYAGTNLRVYRDKRYCKRCHLEATWRRRGKVVV